MITIERKRLPCGKLRGEIFSVWSQSGDWLSLDGKIDRSKCLGHVKATSHKTGLKRAQELFPDREVLVAMEVCPGSDIVVYDDAPVTDQAIS